MNIAHRTNRGEVELEVACFHDRTLWCVNYYSVTIGDGVTDPYELYTHRREFKFRIFIEDNHIIVSDIAINQLLDNQVVCNF